MKVVGTLGSSLLTLVAVSFSLSASVAHADCYPTAWRLPNKGKSCTLVTKFGTPQEALLWSCENADASKTLFLISGTVIQQPEGDICFFVKSVERQNDATGPVL